METVTLHLKSELFQPVLRSFRAIFEISFFLLNGLVTDGHSESVDSGRSAVWQKNRRLIAAH